ncbi:hypothetical protein NCGM2 0877 [Pseudomonas aeruginosa]|nr:hypothetical protein NCGM2 0877 [Pseudomonas aeruginosa]
MRVFAYFRGKDIP